MGIEYRLTFSDLNWYSANVARIADRVRHLPQFTLELGGQEFRLKDPTVANTWSYDLRIFLRHERIDIEVSGSTSTFYSDFRSFYDWIRRETSAQLVDDDGIPVWNDSNDSEGLFTGAFAFPSPHHPDKKQFGMVGCTAAQDGSNGGVMICLHLRESGVTYEADSTSLTLTLPEAEMRALLPVVERALQRLQSLRDGLSSDKPPR